MLKIPIFNKLDKRKKYSNQRSTKKTVNLKKEIKEHKSHSSIFNYSGLNNALLKYNSYISDNKNTADEDQYLSNAYYKNKKKSMTSIDKNSSLYKLKEMNNDLDLILTGMKSNLEGSSINSEKKIINADKFINQINNNNLNLIYNNKKQNDTVSKSYEYLKYSFSFMKICNFNFEIINKKNHFINTDELKENSKNKLEYIFNKKPNDIITVENLIDSLYEYKNNFEEMKLSNKSTLKKYFINDNGINKELEKYIEINKINENNRIIHKEIDFLTEKLTYSFYKGELLLTKYYNKLKEMGININKNIKTITNDYQK